MSFNDATEPPHGEEQSIIDRAETNFPWEYSGPDEEIDCDDNEFNLEG